MRWELPLTGGPSRARHGVNHLIYIFSLNPDSNPLGDFTVKETEEGGEGKQLAGAILLAGSRFSEMKSSACPTTLQLTP